MIVGDADGERREIDMDQRMLVATCLARDDEAIRELIATHRPAIARLASTMLSRDEVDDVCQDVYLRVFKRLGQFEHRSRLGTWIYRVALNVIRNGQRRARRRRADAHVSLDDPAVRGRVEGLTHTATPAWLFESEERARRVRRAILALPSIQRRALALWAYSDASYATIARLTGLPRPEVGRTLRLAKKGVRARVTEETGVF